MFNKTIFSTVFYVLLLSISNAQDEQIWNTHVDRANKTVGVAFGVPETDNVTVMFTCILRSGKLNIQILRKALNVKDKQYSKIGIKGSLSLEIDAVGQYSDMNEQVELEADFYRPDLVADILQSSPSITLTIPGSKIKVPISGRERNIISTAVRECSDDSR